MNLTRRQLTAQFDRAVKLGWLPHFQEAAETITKGYYDTADLIGIGSRETNLDPKWLTKAGDHGNGFGLMQADKRSFPEFTQGDGWKDARTGILFGAKVLMQKHRDYEGTIGKRRTVTSSKGSRYSFTARDAGKDAQHVVISSYNCGLWAQFAFAKGQDIDKYSTGHDYGRDVMERAVVIRDLLRPAATLKEAPPADQPPAPTPAPVVEVPVVTAAPTESTNTAPAESALERLGNKANAAYTAFGTMIAGVIAWFSSSSGVIVLSVMGAVTILGLSYMLINFLRASQKDKRDREDARLAADRELKLKILREQHAQEAQIYSMRSVAEEGLTPVTIAQPPATELPNSDAVAEVDDSAGK